MSPALNRRQLVNAAWAAPVATIATAAPAIAASRLDPAQFELESGFGVGWYGADGGHFQVDTHSDKFFRVVGTQPGDVISNIRVQLRLESWGYDDLTFTKAFNTGQSWSDLVRGDLVSEEGFTFRAYTTTFNGSVTATGSTTYIARSKPELNLFYFQAKAREHAYTWSITHRFVTVTRGGASVDLTINRGRTRVQNRGNSTIPSPANA